MPKSVLEELVTVLGFDIDDDGLKSFNKLSSDAFKTLRNIALVGSGAATAVGVFVNSIASATDETFKFSQTVGASFAEVQQLAHATQIWGGSVEDAMSSLKGLAAITSKATRGAGGGEIFGILGISPSDARTGGPKNTVQLLKEIADNMGRMGDEARQLDLLGQLGISANMILLLRKGSKGINELGQEVSRFGFVLTPEQGRTAESFVDAMVRGKLAVRGLATEVGLRLAPPLEDLVKQFLEWREANREIVDSGLEKFVEILVKSVKPLAIFLAVVVGALAVVAVFAYGAQAAFLALAAAIALAVADFKDFVDGVENTAIGKILSSNIFKNVKNLLGSTFDFAADKLTDFDRSINLGVLSGGVWEGRSAFGELNRRGETTTISPVFHIQSTDPAGAAREVQKKLNELWLGTDYLA